MKTTKIETENFIIKKGRSKKIMIQRGDDEEFEEACVSFFKIMEEEVKDFEIQQKQFEEAWMGKNINKDNVYFTPDKILKKSPLTIIDAPWGTGKTFFVEAIIEHFNRESQKNNNKLFFKKIIYLDAWKYTTSKSAPEELMKELINSLATLNSNFAEKKETYASENEFQFKVKYNELCKFKELPRTILFLDNIERLGKDAWEVLKALWRMSEIENFLFVLPMNQKQLDKELLQSSGEAFFEKYIDIKYFIFEQNYLNFLKNMEFNSSDAEVFNNILNEEIDGQKISIREAKVRIESNKILKLSKKTNAYEIFAIFIKKIWGNIDKVKDYIFDDIEFFIEKLNELEDIVSEVQKRIINDNALMKNLDQKFNLYIIMNNEKQDELLEKIDSTFDYRSNPFVDWTIFFQKWNNLMNDYLAKKVELINTMKNDLIECTEKINDEEKSIKKQQKQIDKLNIKIENENEKKTPTREDIQVWRRSIEDYNLDINKYNNNILILERKYNLFKNKLTYLNEFYNLVQNNYLFVKEKIILFKETKNNYINEKLENKELWNKSKLFFSEEKNLNLASGYFDERFVEVLANIVLKIENK